MADPKKLFIDCFASLGRPAAPAGKPCLTPQELLSDMDRLGIAEAFCADFRALEHSPDRGNRLLCETLRGHPRLHPVWAVLPGDTEELPPPERLLRDMASNNVCLVRAEPVRQGFTLREWGSGGLWAALEACRVPVLLDIGEQWNELDELLSGHPALPVILTRVGYRCNRMLYPLLAARPNLHFELSSYMANEGAAEVVRHFGAARILFATDSPRLSPESAVGTLHFAGLAVGDFQSVAGGNIKRLTEQAGSRLRELHP